MDRVDSTVTVGDSVYVGATSRAHKGMQITVYNSYDALNRPGIVGGSNSREVGAMAKIMRFAPEVRERAVRMLWEHEREYPSRWAAVQSIAGKVGCSAEALRSWVRQAERDTGRQPGPTTDQLQRLKELERENKELRRANEILKKAAAFFAQAELDRRPM